MTAPSSVLTGAVVPPGHLEATQVLVGLDYAKLAAALFAVALAASHGSSTHPPSIVPDVSGARYGADLGDMCAERGWSRSRLILALRQAAQSRGAALPSDDSLRRMIREWVHGRRGLSPFYADLLSLVFDAPFASAAEQPYRQEAQ